MMKYGIIYFSACFPAALLALLLVVSCDEHADEAGASQAGSSGSLTRADEHKTSALLNDPRELRIFRLLQSVSNSGYRTLPQGGPPAEAYSIMIDRAADDDPASSQDHPASDVRSGGLAVTLAAWSEGWVKRAQGRQEVAKLLYGMRANHSVKVYDQCCMPLAYEVEAKDKEAVQQIIREKGMLCLEAALICVCSD